jgi:DNA-binding SARP family transcriptional activator/TolB-like protein
LRLNIFGGASLLENGRPLQRVIAQRRRLALLCIAALESKRGITRARAAALLWPDTDDERARHALSQLIYLLRRELGCDELFGEGEVLRLPEHLIAVDCDEFEAALKGGDLAAAAALYSGDLLDGVELGDSPEMEQWVEGHRARFKSHAADALSALGREAASRGDWKRAAEYCLRLCELKPEDTQAALNAMQALSKATQRETALAVGRRHEKYLRDELDLPVPESVPALIASISNSEQATPPDAALPPPRRDPPESRVTTAALADLPRSGHSFAWRQWSLGRTLGVAAAALIVGAAAIGMNGRRASSVADNRRIAILPFQIRGTDSLGFLREGMVDLIAADLDVGGYSAVNPGLSISTAARYTGSLAGPELGRTVATATGARFFIAGDLVANGPRVRISAGLFETSSPGLPVATAVREGDRENVFGIVDRISLELIAQSIGPVARRFESEAVNQGRPLAAVRSYLDGEFAFRGGHYATAMSDFRQAVDADSTFALAYFRLCIAAEWQGAPFATRQSAVNGALRYAATLSPRERVMLHALNNQMQGEIEVADSMYRSILDKYPDDASAWMQLAELEFHYNQIRGHSFAESRSAFENVYALTADPSALLHLARLASWENHPERAESLLVRYYDAHADDTDPETSLFRSVVANRPNERDSILRGMARASRDTIIGSAWRIAQFTNDLTTADRTAALLTRESRPASDRRIGYQLRAYIAAMSRDWSHTAIFLDSLRPLDPLRSVLVSGILASLPGLRVPNPAMEAVRTRLIGTTSIPADYREDAMFGFAPFSIEQELAHVEGLLSYKMNDSAGLERAATLLERSAASQSRMDSVAMTLASEFHAMALGVRGHDKSALALLAGLENPSRGVMRQLPPHLRYLLGELTSRTGDNAEATRWLGSFDGGFWPDLLYARAANELKRKTASVN